MYTATFCTFVYIFLGSCKNMNIGPQAVQSLLVGEFAKSPIEGDATYAIAFALLSGLVQFVMGIFGLGKTVDNL